jgi:glycosyltransferase involved in cell wall biosynthesis
MKLKIGVDARVLMDKYYSGVSEYAANLLSSILKLDSDNSYHFFYNSFNSSYLRLEKYKRQNCQLRGTRYPNKIFNYFLQKIFKYPKLDSVLGGCDIFFAPHVNFINLKKDTKFIITVHDISFLRYPEFFSRRKNFWHKALYLKKILKRADKIIAVSSNTKDDLVEVLGVNEEKIEVIYSGNNYSEPIKNDKNKVERYLQNNNINSRFILFVGNIEPRKNLVNLIAAYNLLRQEHQDIQDIKLVIAGAPGWKHKKIYNTWHKSPYKHDIRFLGYVSRQEKEYLYQGADIFAYPSFYEGFGFPPLEAMSFSLPVVSSNVSSLPEILGRSALLINPFKPEEIEKAMYMAITNKELRSELISRGLRCAASFSWEKTALKYLELFKKIKEK